MRIGIDVRYLSHGLVGGVHTYLANLLPALLEAGRDHKFFLYADSKAPFELPTLPPHSVLRVLPWRTPFSSIVNDLVGLPRRMAADNLDVLHFPANYGFGPGGVPVVLTLHDAINTMPLTEILRGHPKRFGTVVKMAYLHFATIAAVPRASFIITVSSHARTEIVRFTRVEPGRVVVVYSAPSPAFRRIGDTARLSKLRTRLNLDRPFILADAMKNPDVLVAAWGILPSSLRNTHEIVFFSRQRSVRQSVAEAVARGWAKLLVSPPTDDLVGLYSAAEAFVFPSWIEGFGLPVLEAMACGAPVIASDRGAIPEIANGAARLVAADDAASLAEAVETVLTNPGEAARFRGVGQERVSHFSWNTSAAGYIDTYLRAARASGDPRRQ